MGCVNCSATHIGCASCASNFSMVGGLIGATLSDRDLAALAKSVGLTDEQAVTAVAVALGESGGVTTAHNARPPDDSYGLWQINMIESLGPARRRQFGISRNEELFDPQVNARAMRAISSGGINFRPWSVFTNGSFQRFVPRARQAVAQVSGIPLLAASSSSSASSFAKPLLAAGVLGVFGWWLYKNFGAGQRARRTA